MNPVIAIQPTKEKKYGPFRVLVGKHIEDDPDHPTPLANGMRKEKVYTAADGPFYSQSNLLLMNAPQMSPKFAMVSSVEAPTHDPLGKLNTETQEQYSSRMKQLATEATRLSAPSISVANTLATLEAMNLKELQQWAAEEEIDLKGAKSKEDALKIIRPQIEKGA